MNTINEKEKIVIGGRTLFFSPIKAQEIRKRIVERLKKDARLTAELRHEKLIPRNPCNQLASWSNGNYSRYDKVDNRVIGQAVNGKGTIETRFLNTLRREWLA
jgi:siroheme synthase (precorrin-2 oxidase/ferrochelatase)